MGMILTQDDLQAVRGAVKSVIEDRFEILEQQIAAGFEEVHQKFEEVNQKFETVNQKFEEVNQQFETVNQKFEEVHQKFETVNQKFEEVNQKFETVNQKFEEAHQRFETMNQQFGDVRRIVGGVAVDVQQVKDTVARIEQVQRAEVTRVDKHGTVIANMRKALKAV